MFRTCTHRYFQLQTKGKVLNGTMRLHLWNAEITATITTTEGAIHTTILTHTDKDLVLVNTHAEGGETLATSEGAWQWTPIQGDSPWALTKCDGKKYQRNPPFYSDFAKRSNTHFTTQPLWSNASYSTAYATRTESDGSQTLVVSTAQPQTNANAYVAPYGSASALAAIGAVEAGLSVNFAALRNTHQLWWHSFYKASFVTVSDTQLESFYWIQLYKLASATRGDKAAPSYGACACACTPNLSCMWLRLVEQYGAL